MSQAKLDHCPTQPQSISENLRGMEKWKAPLSLSLSLSLFLSLYVKDTSRWRNEMNVYEEDAWKFYEVYL